LLEKINTFLQQTIYVSDEFRDLDIMITF
jgi:hypothetical protein